VDSDSWKLMTMAPPIKLSKHAMAAISWAAL